jgi:MYXO-CTERM domain-containing protein
VVSLAGPSTTQKVAAGTTLTATWPAAQGAVTYQLGLVNSDALPVWNPAFREASATTLSFNTDGLLAHRRYRAVVRPVSAAGACAETFSDEFSVTDDLPPTGALSGAYGDKGLAIRIDASDNLALDHFTLGWRLPGEQALAPLGDQLLTGRTATATVTFTPPDTSKSIELVLEVFDSANLSTRVTLTASPKGTPPPPPGDGCDCSTGPSRTPGLAELALLLLTMVWVTRRVA